MEQGDFYTYYNSTLLFTETILRTIHNESMPQIMELYRGRYVFHTVSYRKNIRNIRQADLSKQTAGSMKRSRQATSPQRKAAVTEQYSDVHEQFILGGLLK